MPTKERILESINNQDQPKEESKPILELEAINKTFHSAAGSVQVLKGISFKVAQGSFNIIFGPSGSGKSTILNTLMGLEKPDSGKVTFMDEDIYKFNQDEMAQFRAHRYGVVHQASYWVNSLNVLENVALPLLFLGINEQWSQKQAREQLKIVGMEEFSHRDPTTLSGGQQQKIALARSLVNNPWLIVADEPTGNLDSKSGTDVMRILYNLSKKLRRTVVLVTHNLDYVILATQMIYIKDGALSERESALPKPIDLNF